MTRAFHIGLDYGTSASKIVVRDFQAPGGEVAEALDYHGSPRIPSAVVVHDGYVCFGWVASELRAGLRQTGQDLGRIVFESVKMRVADEVQGDGNGACAGPAQAPPSAFRYQELAALTVWWLLCQAGRVVARRADGAPVRVGMTLGIPMAFLWREFLRSTFLEIARVGWRLWRDNPVLAQPFLSCRSARERLSDAQERAWSVDRGSVDDREWLRSEAEAAVLGAFRSPAILAGPYVKVDVGAGTTNCSLFRIKEDAAGVRERLVFFGANSADVGMDAVGQALCKHVGQDPTRWYELRGEEHAHLGNRDAQAACATTLDEIVMKGRNPAWRFAYDRYRHSIAEQEAWRRAGVFLLGGGSRVGALGERLLIYPLDATLRLRREELGCPDDLVSLGRPPDPDVLRFLHVAYGLSFLPWDVPPADPPDQDAPVVALPRPRRRRDHEEIYG